MSKETRKSKKRSGLVRVRNWEEEEIQKGRVNWFEESEEEKGVEKRGKSEKRRARAREERREMEIERRAEKAEGGLSWEFQTPLYVRNDGIYVKNSRATSLHLPYYPFSFYLFSFFPPIFIILHFHPLDVTRSMTRC